LNKGGFLEYYTNVPHVVRANKPIYTNQMLVGILSGPIQPGTGDPSLFAVPPVDQFLFNYIFLTPDTFQYDFINIIAPSGTVVTLDNMTQTVTCTGSEAGVIGGKSYCCARYAVVDGVHTVSGNQKFGLTVSGFAYAGSYAYIGGVGLQPINAGCVTGGPYQAEVCDVSVPVPLNGTADCADGTTPSVLWSSTSGVVFSIRTIADPTVTVPNFGTYDVCLQVTCGRKSTVKCCSTIEVFRNNKDCAAALTPTPAPTPVLTPNPSHAPTPAPTPNPSHAPMPEMCDVDKACPDGYECVCECM
jgi:hypothetical protein